MNLGDTARDLWHALVRDTPAFGRSRPTAPRNVRLVYPDGTVVWIECVYEGVQDGLHSWVAVAPAGVQWLPGMELRIEQLPARTSVRWDAVT